MRWKAAAALAALLGAAAVLRRITGTRGSHPPHEPAGDGAPSREPWQCACGARFMVAGRDRHRVYWLEGADESDPLLADRCPSCDRALPAEHAVGAA